MPRRVLAVPAGLSCPRSRGGFSARGPRNHGHKRRLFFLLPLAVFAIVVVALAMGLNRDPTLLPSALIDRPAPDFALPGLYDPKTGLTRAELLGGVTLVNFFASWCGPSREEQPALM